jgi:hypothetical protein
VLNQPDRIQVSPPAIIRIFHKQAKDRLRIPTVPATFTNHHPATRSNQLSTGLPGQLAASQ